eukprot:CAMPEP_0181361710 /NCGR_PEP_ID=MMETSP1106-20121128/7499_1 /TAXON_ID=81844 /ORGANISM="Mantoniella antarctica, Strain SL-175" /LENGTH=222 /DNA_ID=CAMNT_0023475377 /DNA_START=262 /DNA_END=930 /DNA_ORIENTATION=-
MGVPYVSRITALAYQGALLSAAAGFTYRIVYSTKLEGYTLAAVRAAVAPMVASNGFQYTMYCALFITGRPVPTVLFPLMLHSGYQVATIVNKHFGETAAYKRVGGERLFAYAQANMHRALMMCATMEVSVLMLMLIEVFKLRTARSVFTVAFYLLLLRAKHACTDNTVFRIKFTYYNTGFYHQQMWNMIDERTAPILQRVSSLQAPVNMLKRWFTGSTKKQQ